jgi:hypothetical protein
MKNYNSTKQSNAPKPMLAEGFYWYHRNDVKNHPKEDCDVLIWLNTPVNSETRIGYFYANEFNEDNELINDFNFALKYDTHCINSVNNWNDNFEWWCHLPMLPETFR